MLFPDQAPSRLRLARGREQAAADRGAAGAGSATPGADPGAVAREILTLVAALQRPRPADPRPRRAGPDVHRPARRGDARSRERDRDLLRWAALLHDIGKLQVPATLLNKPGKPTERRVGRAQGAPGARRRDGRRAAAVARRVGRRVIVEHHERYDGTGYPLGLAGRGISLGARIVSVADAYDVMTAARAYKRPVSRAAAGREPVRHPCTQCRPRWPSVRAMRWRMAARPPLAPSCRGGVDGAGSSAVAGRDRGGSVPERRRTVGCRCRRTGPRCDRRGNGRDVRPEADRTGTLGRARGRPTGSADADRAGRGPAAGPRTAPDSVGPGRRRGRAATSAIDRLRRRAVGSATRTARADGEQPADAQSTADVDGRTARSAP